MLDKYNQNTMDIQIPLVYLSQVHIQRITYQAFPQINYCSSN